MSESTFDTSYFPLDIVRDGVRGCCHQFAYAIHRRTGWRLAVLWRDPAIDKFTLFPDPDPLHVFCLTADGRGIDVEGVRTTDEMIEHWRPSALRHAGLRVVPYADLRAYDKAMHDAGYPMLVPSDNAVAMADKALGKSKPFLALVAELSFICCRATPVASAPG